MSQITTKTLFTDRQILKLAGKDTKMITYPNLKRYKSLNELFGNKKNVIILYVHNETPSNITGHWCGVIKHPNSYEFFDSYGLLPDDIIMMKTEEDREETRQEHNYLSELLYNANKEVEYNEYQYQDNNQDVNTCGAHTGVRCRFSDIPLTEYQHVFNLLKNHGVNTDKLVVELAKLFL